MAKPKKKGGPKQKLSAKASTAKKVRDKKMAMTPLRRAKKAENQRIGQSPSYDIHHIGGKLGNTRKTSVNSNRGGGGKGTRNEGRR